MDLFPPGSLLLQFMPKVTEYFAWNSCRMLEMMISVSLFFNMERGNPEIQNNVQVLQLLILVWAASKVRPDLVRPQKAFPMSKGVLIFLSKRVRRKTTIKNLYWEVMVVLLLHVSFSPTRLLLWGSISVFLVVFHVDHSRTNTRAHQHWGMALCAPGGLRGSV